MQFWFADVRSAIRILLDLFAQPFKALTADVLKPDAIRPRRRAFVKINRDRKLLPDAFAGFMCERHALSDRHATDGHKWQDISCADPRVHTYMSSQVDQLFRGRHGAKGRVDDHPRLAYERDH